jgi:hypothetical protein
VFIEIFGKKKLLSSFLLEKLKAGSFLMGLKFAGYRFFNCDLLVSYLTLSLLWGKKIDVTLFVFFP